MGTSAWASVPESLSKRFTAKQCRDRWYNYANPDLNHGPWSAEEDRQLTAWQNKYGKKWAKVKDKMPGRSGPMCKARWGALGGDSDVGARGGGGGNGGKRGGGKRKNRRGDDDDEEEEEEDEGDMNDDEEFETSPNVQKKVKSTRAAVGGKQLPAQFTFELGDEFDGANMADNDSSSVMGALGLGMEGAAFAAQGDVYELSRGMTPYQGHIVSSMFGSPFMASGMTPLPLSLHGSPGIMRLQKRQLFSPSVPEMTPVRPSDMANFSSPSMDPFFQPAAPPPPPPEQLPQWMTPLRPASAMAQHAAAANQNHGVPFNAFAKTAIIPVSNTRRRQLYAINQKFKSPAVGVPGGVDSPVPAAPAAPVAAASVPQTPLADLPPVTLFNGGRHHPIQELLELLRRNDALAVFGRAASYLKKCKLEDAAARAELLTVADAASSAQEQPHLSVMSPGDALDAD
jgi:hypothetical protein